MVGGVRCSYCLKLLNFVLMGYIKLDSEYACGYSFAFLSFRKQGSPLLLLVYKHKERSCVMGKESQKCPAM